MSQSNAIESYVHQVKRKFENQPHIYNSFLQIMKEFKNKTISTAETVTKVSNLFQGYPELIVEFSKFLSGYIIKVYSNDSTSNNPDNKHIESSENKLQISQPIGGATISNYSTVPITASTNNVHANLIKSPEPAIYKTTNHQFSQPFDGPIDLLQQISYPTTSNYQNSKSPNTNLNLEFQNFQQNTEEEYTNSVPPSQFFLSESSYKPHLPTSDMDTSWLETDDMNKFDVDLEDDLITAVRARPAMWNINSKDYRNLQLTNRMWEDISLELSNKAFRHSKAMSFLDDKNVPSKSTLLCYDDNEPSNTPLSSKPSRSISPSSISPSSISPRSISPSSTLQSTKRKKMTAPKNAEEKDMKRMCLELLSQSQSENGLFCRFLSTQLDKLSEEQQRHLRLKFLSLLSDVN